jgi:hypothetical protein
VEGNQPFQVVGQYPGLPPFFVPEPPKRPKTGVRYILGAIAIFSVGVAVAGFSVATTHAVPTAPTPPAASQLADEGARAIWRTAPVDALFPPTVATAPTETAPIDQYIRLGVATPAGCSALPQAFLAAITTAAPGTSCVNVLRATYTDTTRTVLATVGIVVVNGTATARDQVWRGWTPDSDTQDPAMMPSVYPVPGTAAASFADAQRVVWNSEATDDGAFLTYVVTGFADGRQGSTNAQITSNTGRALQADSPPVQAAGDLTNNFISTLANLEKNGSAS